MKSRLFVLFCLALAGAIAVLLIRKDPAPMPLALHGDFSQRFAPGTPLSDHDRLAGVGSITKLRPVEIKGR